MKKVVLTVVMVCAAMGMAAQDFVVTKGERVGVLLPETGKQVLTSAFDMLREDGRKVLGAELVTVKKAKKAKIVCSVNTALPREGYSIRAAGGRLLVEGADAHGLAYGLLRISREMGVSPWEYWADCTPRQKTELRLAEGKVAEEHPAVAYRGIFINDEDWGMNPWATAQEPEALTTKAGRIVGAVGPKVNEKIFQLLLRLNANYYWPAMHECTQPFFLTQGNREMAAKYGIYIGGSHCEPMACSAAAEWGIRGKGEYNYVDNREAVKAFWQERLDAVRDQEIVYTIGMRGVHDGSMQGVKTKEDKLKYLQMVIDDQREMLKGKELLPQVFVPYKEVLEIYKSGLEVPEDVALMWTDDNYGYIRHYPDAKETARKGGNGIYYHVSYWGRPHDYTWLATSSPYQVHQQLKEGYERGIRSMWILNVGDIKPAEYLIEEFMDLAWKGDIDVKENMREFYAREFGEAIAGDLANVMDEYYDLAFDRKPEHMAGTRVEEKDKPFWNQVKAMEGWTRRDVEKRMARYQRISDEVERLWKNIPENRKDAFFELVKYPVQGSAQMNFKYLSKDRCEEAHDSIQNLTYYYNKVCAGGKWDKMMSGKPRGLRVFDTVKPEEVKEYPETVGYTEITPRDHDEWSVVKGERNYTFACDGDTAVIQVRLLPSYPVGEEYRLAFAVQVDGGEEMKAEYQTYDREEEWKLNVMRNYAVREFRIPVKKLQGTHTLTFKPLTDGVILRSILLGSAD